MGLSVMCITEDFYEENGNRQLKQILGIIMKEKVDAEKELHI